MAALHLTVTVAIYELTPCSLPSRLRRWLLFGYHSPELCHSPGVTRRTHCLLGDRLKSDCLPSRKCFINRQTRHGVTAAAVADDVASVMMDPALKGLALVSIIAPGAPILTMDIAFG